MPKRIVLAALLVGISTTAGAEVLATSANGFFLRSQATVAATPDKTYRALVGEIGRWWNPDHTYSGDAANLSIEARPGGCFCEKLPGGGGVEHGSVLYLAPGKTLRLAGALGPLQASGVTGSLTWKLAAEGAGTKMEMTYSVGGYMQEGFEKMAPLVDSVMSEQFARLKTYAETGKPTAPK